jgi:hypothetical protein
MHKSMPGAVDEQFEAASRYTGWPTERSEDPVLAELCWGTPHDRLDAYLSSWVASLPEDERVAFGQPPGDAVWVPQLAEAWSRVAHKREARSASTSRGSTEHAPSTSRGNGSLVCPACGEHPFKRWP